MDIEIIGLQIQKFRKRAGMTQKELGEAVGVSTQAVSQWENGGAPDVSLLPAVADRLGVTVDALFGREGGQVQDMETAFLGWLRSLPESERLTRINRLLWDGAIYGTSSDLMLNMPRIGYPREAENKTLGLMRVTLGIDSGYIMGVGAEDYSYMGVFPKPREGYERYFLTDDEYRVLFAALSMPGAMETLRYFCRNRDSYYVPAAVAKGTGLTVEEAERILEALTEATGQMVRQEITLPDGPVSAYAYMEDGGLVALLSIARWMRQGNHTYLTANCLGKQPFEREEGQNEKT